MREWEPETALTSIDLERTTLSTSPEDMAMHIFKESLPGAAASIAYLAMYDNNPRIRLEAAKYVVDRNLGRISDAAALLGGKEKPEWEKLVSNSIGAYVPDDPATH